MPRQGTNGLGLGVIYILDDPSGGERAPSGCNVRNYINKNIRYRTVALASVAAGLSRRSSAGMDGKPANAAGGNLGLLVSAEPSVIAWRHTASGSLCGGRI